MQAIPTALTPSARPPLAAPRPVPEARPPWGWLEWTVLAQVAMPALLFIPGFSAIRIVTRITIFVIPLMAWILLAGHRRPGSKTFPAAPILAVASGWLLISIGHPSANSLLSALAQVMLYLAVLSPVFWASAALRSEVQLRRLMAILLFGNAASALLGIGQFYRPDIFNPPVIAYFGQAEHFDGLSYTSADGRKVMRPCGLSDTPGAACIAGIWAGVIGLGWSLRPIAAWKRLACLGLAMVGLAVIYFTMVRSALLLTVLGGISLFGFLLLRRDWRKASQLAVAGSLILVLSFAWAARDGGEVIRERFGSLLEKNIATNYQEHRGYYLQQTFKTLIFQYPMGAGPGRWGMMFQYFGDHSLDYGRERGPVWAEIQWAGWIFDGGVLLMATYALALLAAMLSTAKIGLTSPDPEVAYWAAVVWGVNFAIIFQTLGSVPFVTGVGVQFWVLAAALHAADSRTRWRRQQQQQQKQQQQRKRMMTASPPGWPPRGSSS
jgi:hypothetical protein